MKERFDSQSSFLITETNKLMYHTTMVPLKFDRSIFDIFEHFQKVNFLLISAHILINQIRKMTPQNLKVYFSSFPYK